jgi:hypothetical protein
MDEEVTPEGKTPEGKTWRGAFIGAIVAIIISPLSLAIQYYVNRNLAAPKLSMQYLNPAMDYEPFVIDKPTADKWRAAQQMSLPNLYSSVMGDLGTSGCDREVNLGAVSTRCFDLLQSAVRSNRESLEFYLIHIQQDRKAIELWSGKDALRLFAIEVPDLGEPLEVAAREHRKDTIAILHNGENTFAEVVASDDAFLSKMKDFASAKPKRTGQVTFKIAILNAGDSDAIIFPQAANLSFGGASTSQNTLSPKKRIIALRPSVPTVPYYRVFVSDSSTTSPFSVVRTHSFQEAVFVIDEGSAGQDDLNAWRSHVVHEDQLDFTITLTSSAGLISGAGTLPPEKQTMNPTFAQTADNNR